MTKSKKIIIAIIGGILFLGIVGKIISKEDYKTEDNSDVNVSMSYKLSFVSPNIIEVTKENGDKLEYNPDASNTSVGEAVEEYRKLATYGYYAFQLQEKIGGDLNTLDSYLPFTMQAPLTSDVAIDNPEVRDIINHAYQYLKEQNNLDQNFLIDKKGSSKAYCVSKENGKTLDIIYIYVEKSSDGGTILRKEEV